MKSPLNEKGTEPLVSIIESHVTPCWERFGKAGLAVPEDNQAIFRHAAFTFGFGGQADSHVAIS